MQPRKRDRQTTCDVLRAEYRSSGRPLEAWHVAVSDEVRFHFRKRTQNIRIAKANSDDVLFRGERLAKDRRSVLGNADAIPRTGSDSAVKTDDDSIRFTYGFSRGIDVLLQCIFLDIRGSKSQTAGPQTRNETVHHRPAIEAVRDPEHDDLLRR